MSVQFVKAVKSQSKLRMAIDGPAGSGKTYTALQFATALAGPDGRVAVIDTEHASASKYADRFEFDVLVLENYNPKNYIEGIKAAEQAGYSVVVIDSLSHAWEGEGGVLDLHDQATKRQVGNNSFAAWKDVTPIHRDLVEAMLQSSCHVIATMRSKMDYLQTEENGRKSIKKVGLAPVQRAGMEYEFDVLVDMDYDHNMIVSKTRFADIADEVVSKPGATWFQKVIDWLTSGAKPAPAPQFAPAAQPAAPAPVVAAPPPAVAAPKNGNGKVERPLAPAKLRELLLKKTESHREPTPLPTGTVATLNAAIKEMLAKGGAEDPDEGLHALLDYLTGSPILGDVHDSMVRSIQDWMKAEPSEHGWVFGDYVVAEAKAAMDLSLVEAASQGIDWANQTDLFGQA